MDVVSNLWLLRGDVVSLLPVVIVAMGLLSAAGAYIILSYILRKHRNAALMQSIPEASGGEWFFIGHGLQLAKGQPWNTFYEWAKRCGGTCRFHVLGRDIFYTSEPKLIKRVFQTHQRNYHKDLDFSYKEFMCILGRGLVTSEDQAWVRGRMLLSHAFRIDILEGIPSIALAAVGRLCDKLRKDALKPVDLSEEFRCLTLQVIAEAVLSFTPEESDRLFPALYLPIVTECNERVWAPWRKWMVWSDGYRRRKSCLAQLNAYLANLVRERWAAKLQGKPQHDIFGTCLDHVKTFNDDTVLQLRDDLKTFLLAGHETSAAMLSWAVYELACNPETSRTYLERVREEYETVFVKNVKSGQVPTLKEVQDGLTWAPAVLREALRLYSVVPLVVRKADKDDVIHPEDSNLPETFTLPKDTVVMIGMDGVHRREDIWGSDAHQFHPERFLDMSKIDPFAFIPFISGPRNCLGQHLALLESTIVLSALVYHFDFSLKPGLRTPLERHHRIVPLAPAEGLWVLPRVSAAALQKP